MKIQAEATSQYAKLPTFRQFCKTEGEKCNNNAKVVTTVWFPNKYPSLSIDTEVFRLRISESDPNYAAIEAGLREGIDADEVFIVRILDAKKFAFEIETLEGETGGWDFLGDSGAKCEVLPKRKRKPSATTLKSAADASAI